MIDIGTGLAIWGGKELLVKLLGPTADYIGEGAKDFVEKRNSNIKKIFDKARNLLGPKLDQPGGVPPRILKEIIENGSYCEDELSAEYYGGILASSRSKDSKDDRGVPLINLIKSLSNYQIRTHYIFYSIFRKVYLNSTINMSINMGRMAFYIPARLYNAAMEISPDEDITIILSHSILGLQQNALIENYVFGNKEHLQKSNNMFPNVNSITENGMTIIPSQLGASLFLWANGFSNERESILTEESFDFRPFDHIKFPDEPKPKPLSNS